MVDCARLQQDLIMPAGAPKGNTNSSKSNRLWADTIRRVVTQGKTDKLRKIAEKLVEMAEKGDMAAIKEVGDRIDGRSVQAIEGTGDDGAFLVTSITRQIVKPK